MTLLKSSIGKPESGRRHLHCMCPIKNSYPEYITNSKKVNKEKDKPLLKGVFKNG